MKQTVVAIGNFDGLHLGHVHLLEAAKASAIQNDLDFAILTFSPHPRQVFQPNVAPFRITPDWIKVNIIQTLIKPDIYKALPFNEALQSMKADQFIDKILIDDMNAAIVMVGHDFRFGHNREGSVSTLQDTEIFETVPAELLTIDDMPVTSTRIREHLKKAEMKQANALLGWDWYVEGEVVHGDKRGRELGYPTANMHFGETLVPSHGVYAVKVQIEGESEWRDGAANIGLRPMFETALPMLETYIFDFEGDLYGQKLKIKPVQKLRDEMKFDSLDALKDQMKQDCILVKNILHNS